MADLTHEELVERVAVECWRASVGIMLGFGRDLDAEWASFAPHDREHGYRAARAAISTIAEALREPTGAMIDAVKQVPGMSAHLTVDDLLSSRISAAIAASPLYGAKE